MYKMSLLDKISIILVIIGAINWGILGITDFNLVSFIFGYISPILERIICILIGVSGLNLLVLIIRTKSLFSSTKNKY